VTEFNYLGVTFTKNGKFKLAKQKNIEKATKAMYEVIRRGKRHNLSIECLLDLFDKIVKPILLYGCEVWGFSDNYVIEKIHLKFCKLILHLKQSTPNFMIYGELGRFPLYIYIKTRVISYWCKLPLASRTIQFCVHTCSITKKNYAKVYKIWPTTWKLFQ
jgi:hypothetical protein